MRFLTYEFFCGKGVGVKQDISILSEGFSLLKLIAEGLKRTGNYTVVIMSSSLIEMGYRINVDKVIETSGNENFPDFIREKADEEEIDFVFPIAPDLELVKIVEFLNSEFIGTVSSERCAIRIAADKFETYKVLKESGIRTPWTDLLLDDTHIYEYPVIVKDRYGISCENLSLINNSRELETLRETLRDRDNLIIQHYINGMDASVTLFSDGKNAVPISLNKQEISLGRKSSYNGGIVPSDHPQKEEAFRSAKMAVQSIKGLKGCIGVDMVIAEEPYVMEINPRVTTSMVALEMASDMNIAESAVNAYMGKLPDIPRFNKKIRFTKYNGVINFEEI